MKSGPMSVIERCYMLCKRIPEKEFDDNGNMVSITIAPNPLDRRLSRKRKCDSKAANDGDDDEDDENCLKSRESLMASSNKGVRGQPTGGASKKTKSNIQPKKLTVTAKQPRSSTASRRNAASLKPPSAAPERSPSPSSPRRRSRRPSVAPPPPADPGLPSAAATVEIAKDDDGATRVADVADVASKTEEAVKKFTITASKASTVFRIDLAELRRMRIKQGKAPGINRVIYARKAGEPVSAEVLEGEKIDLELASKLKEFTWGSPNMPPKAEWEKQGVVFHTSDQLFAFGLKCPKNSVKNFLLCLEAYFLKHLLFEKSKKGAPSASLLRVSEKSQVEMLVGGLAELLMKVADGDEAVFCMPGTENCFEPTAHYGIDGITERLRLMKTKKEDEMKGIIRRYSGRLMEENGGGLICVLYSLLASRNFERLERDLQDQITNSLIDPLGQPTLQLLSLVIMGKALPYLHNGIMVVDCDDDFAGEERRGVEGRNDLGLLIWDKDETTTADYSLGSRLKTPVLPIWLTLCNGHVGLLFNPNRDLMRSYHAENRFQLYYFSDADMRKEERRDTILTIDTRNVAKATGEENNDADFDDVAEPPLQLAIQTKWEGCEVSWNGVTPYV